MAPLVPRNCTHSTTTTLSSSDHMSNSTTIWSCADAQPLQESSINVLFAWLKSNLRRPLLFEQRQRPPKTPKVPSVGLLAQHPSSEGSKSTPASLNRDGSMPIMMLVQHLSPGFVIPPCEAPRAPPKENETFGLGKIMDLVSKR